MEHNKIGTVISYFPDIHIAEVELERPVRIGQLLVVGDGEDRFEQAVESIQIGEDQVETAEAGAVVGLHIHTPVEPGAPIYFGAE